MTKATGPLFAVHFRRRREERTDYAKRLALLKSFKPRLVVRKTNKYVIVQIVEFSQKGDKVLASCSSKHLTEYGFAGKCNTPSAYLTGLLVGRMALGKAKEFVLDIGLHAPTKGSLVFAAAKGAFDAGLKTAFSLEKFPSEERMAGAHLGLKEKFTESKTKIMGAAFK